MSEMADRPRRRRKNAVRGGILLAGAAVVIAGGGLLAAQSSGSHGAHSAAQAHSVGAAKAQTVDLPSQPCADMEKQIQNQRSVDEQAASACDSSEVSATNGFSGICMAINARTQTGDLSLPVSLEIHCNDEEVQTAKKAGVDGADTFVGSLCAGAKTVLDNNGQVDPQILQACSLQPQS